MKQRDREQNRLSLSLCLCRSQWQIFHLLYCSKPCLSLDPGFSLLWHDRMKGDRRRQRDVERGGAVTERRKEGLGERKKEREGRTECLKEDIIVLLLLVIVLLILCVQSLFISLNPSLPLCFPVLFPLKCKHKTKANNQSCSIINKQDRVLWKFPITFVPVMNTEIYTHQNLNT